MNSSHKLNLREFEIQSNSVNDTLKIGSIIARNLRAGDIVCLFGQLGSGKTVLTKGIAKGLGIDKAKVYSPSFVLIREHAQGRLPLYHFDLYRLNTIEDIMALGYEEYLFDRGVTIIEWADRLKYLLPEEFLKIELFFGEDSKRQLKFTANGKRHGQLLKKTYEDIGH